MLIPRRVRRRLLLPPGWVALGFLLLLGCQALRLWQGQLRQWSVIQLTMPSFGKDKLAPWNKIVYQSHGQLNRMRPWHDIEFRGWALQDSLNAAKTASVIRKIMSDNRHAGGVRVRFLPGATYANLVSVLDIMSYTGQKNYWLDIHHQPVTLYAVTNESLVADPTECLLCNDVIKSTRIPVAQTTQQLLAEFWKQVISLEQRVWRQPLWLLLVISGLSLGRLLHKK